MCGVAGFVGRDPAARARAAAALAAMAHRGPDGRGVWVDPGERAWLAHARLALRDADGGAQPMSSEDGRIWTSVNGEIYDADRWRAWLTGRGHTLRTGSDSELVAHLYEELGEGFVERVNGELAFALYDRGAGVMVVGRDRFGIKPLVWAKTEAGVAVASTARALFAMGAARGWDEGVVAHCLSMQYEPPGRTLYAGVREVCPGEVVTLDAGGRLAGRRYWDIGWRPEAELDDEVDVAQIREALRVAVARRLVADAPVGFYVSGGIDSCAVLGAAVEEGARAPEAFTIAFDQAPYDEREIAARVCARVGARLHVVEASGEAMLATLPDAVAHGEGMAINGHISAKYLLSRAARDAGVKAVLVGEGADEVFAGYPHLRQDLYAAEPGALARLARANPASDGVMLASGGGDEVETPGLGLAPSWVRAKRALGRRVSEVAAPGFMAAWGGDDPLARMLSGENTNKIKQLHPVRRAMHLWTRAALARYILRQIGDATEMAHGIEGRVPYLDHELVEATRGLPVSALIRGGVEKWPLREAARGWVPEEVRTRPKHPLIAPPLPWDAPGAARTRELLLDVSAKVPFLDAAALEDLLGRLDGMDDARRRAWDPVLVMAASACVLQERMLEEPAWRA
jgi:asparagine synthase (glutamine-hydrolysing)